MWMLIRKWLPKEEADYYFNLELYPALKQHSVVFSGKSILMPRLTAWCSDDNQGYKYSGQETPSSPWTPELLKLKGKVEEKVQRKLTSVLFNYYRDGNDSVGWHKDDESIFGEEPLIASLSLGETRPFKFRNRGTDSAALDLQHGDLLIFDKEHVLRWEHTIPKTKIKVGPRLNLTFRTGKE